MIYKLEYLPLARKDMSDITTYISDTLKAPKAALDLLDAIETSMLTLKQFPFSCKVYLPLESLKDEYRLLPVKNYAILYVVVEDTVEIRRVVYAKMNLNAFIN